MLFNSAILRAGTRVGARRVTSAGSFRHGSTSGAGIPPNLLSGWYSIFGSSNAGYLMWIVGGVIFSEFATGAVTDAAWNSVNKGRTYDSVDWSKFIVEDDDDDDDDEDEDDEEEEEEEDSEEGESEEEEEE